jgi:hypothetical protein
MTSPHLSSTNLLRSLWAEREARGREAAPQSDLRDEKLVLVDLVDGEKPATSTIFIEDDPIEQIKSEKVFPVNSNTANKPETQSHRSFTPASDDLSIKDLNEAKQDAEEIDRQLALTLQQEVWSDTMADWSDGGGAGSPLPITGSGDGPPSPTDEDVAPDAHELFLYYDRLYFGSTLAARAVVVEWSRRMTLCAGQCSYRGRGSVCRVALSEPLLKFRSATEVKETLLHEMIHAWPVRGVCPRAHSRTPAYFFCARACMCVCARMCSRESDTGPWTFHFSPCCLLAFHPPTTSTPPP